METLSHTIGRDPIMDRAIARVAESLDDFDRTQGTDTDLARQLAVSARRLWRAATRLNDGERTVRFAELRISIRDLIVDCTLATHALHHDEDVVMARLHHDFARVVRRYRAFVLADQAARFNELQGRWL